jgi:hypothetical protein
VSPEQCRSTHSLLHLESQDLHSMQLFVTPHATAQYWTSPQD